MSIPHSNITPKDPIPMLDEEFDKTEIVPPDANDHPPLTLSDDLAWDDQLDNGEEMSL